MNCRLGVEVGAVLGGEGVCVCVCWGGGQLLPKMDAEFTFDNSFPLCV